jgi:3-phenylpropionate/trans-cinnamate dioxygenase ferredoxin component
MAEFTTVGRADEVAEGLIKAYDVGGQQIAVTRIEGTLYAFSDTCTHRGCSLSTGETLGTAVECECHGSVFDMTSGAVVEGPATEPVATFGARDEGGDLQIEA